MSKPLDDEYITWLYSHVGSVKTRARSRTFWSLLRLLYTKEFVWIVANDDNRIEDGRELRREFVDDLELDDVDEDWMDLGCSVLEMMVALSDRVSFLTDRAPDWWFWEMVRNVGLESLNDSVPINEEAVDEILNRVIWRQYDSNGNGGFFPLRDTVIDQRDVELWYQANAYVIEND